jgi:muconolactone delta-isomerase
MGDRRFPQHAHGAAATIAYRASPSPNLCGYFWGEVRRIPLLGTSVNRASRVALSSMGHHSSAMPQYMVTMDITRADPLLPIDLLAEVIREAVLPSVERLLELKAQRKVITGGYPIGQRAIVFIIETDSEEELYEILEGLPLSEIAEARVTPLKSFEELRWVD